MGKRILCYTVLIVLCLGSGVFAGSIYETYGMGSRASALGGAFTAVADDWTAAIYNPAGLPQTKGHRIVSEFFFTSPSFEVRKLNGDRLLIYDNTGEVRNDPTEKIGSGHGLDVFAPESGIIIDFNQIIKDLPVEARFGLALSLPEWSNVAYNVHSLPPDQPQFLRYGDNTERAFVVTSIGVELVKDLLSVGIGQSVMATGVTDAYAEKVDLVEFLGATESKPAVAMLRGVSRYDTDAIAGILITPLDKKVRIGLSFRDEEELYLHPNPTTAQLLLPGGMTIEQTTISDQKAFYTPTDYAVGLALTQGSVMVSLQADKQMWSNYHYSEAVERNYEENTPDFEDTINYRVGIELKKDEDPEDPTCSSILLGYYYQPSPVPDQSGRVSNIIDMDKHVLSVGVMATVEPQKVFALRNMNNPITAGAFFQYQFCEDLKVNKDGVQGKSWQDQESYTVEGDVWTIGVSVAYRFSKYL